MGAVAAPSEYQLIGSTASGGVGEIFSALDQKQGRVRLQALIAEGCAWTTLLSSPGPENRSVPVQDDDQTRNCSLCDTQPLP